MRWFISRGCATTLPKEDLLTALSVQFQLKRQCWETFSQRELVECLQSGAVACVTAGRRGGPGACSRMVAVLRALWPGRIGEDLSGGGAFDSSLGVKERLRSKPPWLRASPMGAG